MAQNFKDRLKILMKDMRPYSFAQQVGIQRGLFQYYWKKDGIPTYENLLKIQRYTGCSLDWLLTGDMPTLDDSLSGIRFKMRSSAESATRQRRFTNSARKLKALYAYLPVEKLSAIEIVIEALGKRRPVRGE